MCGALTSEAALPPKDHDATVGRARHSKPGNLRVATNVDSTLVQPLRVGDPAQRRPSSPSQPVICPGHMRIVVLALTQKVRPAVAVTVR
jgi:hypothetical protein